MTSEDGFCRFFIRSRDAFDVAKPLFHQVEESKGVGSSPMEAIEEKRIGFEYEDVCGDETPSFHPCRVKERCRSGVVQVFGGKVREKGPAVDEDRPHECPFSLEAMAAKC